MKKKIFAGILFVVIAMGACAQDKKEIKKLEKEYMWLSHKKFFNNTEWAMCKFTIVYKLTTAMTAKDRDKAGSGAGAMKAKISSGAYGMLNGITEEDLQQITNKVAENFIKRMKEEAGVNISTWSTFKDAENTKKLKENDEEREIYSKSQGLAYAMSYDETPHYYRVIQFVPGGKKLSKEIEKQVIEFTLYVDFADVVATASVDVKSDGYTRGAFGTGTTFHYKISKDADQTLAAGVRLVPNLGSEAAVSEFGKNLGNTSIKGHDKSGYYFGIGLRSDMVSNVPYVEKIEDHEGEIPKILANRRNKKLEHTKTFSVFTTPEKYGEAVMDVSNQYFDALIKLYNANAK